MKIKMLIATALTSFLAIILFATDAFASHSWGGYHWARAQSPFTLKLGDNVSAVWDQYLVTASTDWSESSVLDTSIVAGASRKNCRPTAGRVEICNAKYGNNGWLGIAQIWITNGEHITQGTVKMNDTYFSTAKYNTPAWRQLVLCQEIGHTFGLDHQDEDFANLPLGSCMDYSNDPILNQHPNIHDYEQLEAIYAHLDANITVAQNSPAAVLAMPGQAEDDEPWGQIVRRDLQDRPTIYEHDLGKGNKKFTFVFWADHK